MTESLEKSMKSFFRELPMPSPREIIESMADSRKASSQKTPKLKGSLNDIKEEESKSLNSRLKSPFPQEKTPNTSKNNSPINTPQSSVIPSENSDSEIPLPKSPKRSFNLPNKSIELSRDLSELKGPSTKGKSMGKSGKLKKGVSFHEEDCTVTSQRIQRKLTPFIKKSGGARNTEDNGFRKKLFIAEQGEKSEIEEDIIDNLRESCRSSLEKMLNSPKNAMNRSKTRKAKE